MRAFGLAIFAALSITPPCLAAVVTTDVSSCATCHGAHGEGKGAVPRLAAQSPAYLNKQLAAYADGSRNNAVMTPIVKGLDAARREALSQYYADLAPPQTKGKPSSNDRARILVTIGDDKLRVQACQNCHGPEGSGEPPSFPYLAGQTQDYLLATLADWKSGKRATDPSAQMSAIIKQLTADDLNVLAQYYAALPTPPRPTQQVPARAGTTSPPSKTATPPSGQGGGSEGGEPTTGGSQGPGGGGASNQDSKNAR